MRMRSMKTSTNTDTEAEELDAGKKVGVKDVRAKRQYFTKKFKNESMSKKAFTPKRQSVKL